MSDKPQTHKDAPDRPRHLAFTTVLVIASTGLGVGFLTGLSVSPTVQILISSLLGTAVAAIAVLAGIQRTEGLDVANTPKYLGQEVDFKPLAVLTAAVVLGVCVGVVARTHEWLGDDPKLFAARWSVTEMTPKDLAVRLFNQLHPAVTPTAAEPHPGEIKSGEAPHVAPLAPFNQPTIFSARISSSECERLAGLKGLKLRQAMAASFDSRVLSVEPRFKHDEDLLSAVELFLCPATR
jgi:hypothetical protein